MSLESALEIFKKQGFSDPQWAVKTIQKARSLDDLRKIMVDEKTHLSEDQFVSFRMSALFKGDYDFARKIVEDAKKRFGNCGLPEEIVNYYISNGGGVDTSIAIMCKMDLGKMPKVEDRTKLRAFYDAAKQYLFQALRDYVTDLPP